MFSRKRRLVYVSVLWVLCLRLAGVRTKCFRKNGERGIPYSDKTFLFKEVDGYANQSRVE